MKRIFLPLMLLAAVLVSCTKDFEEYNTDPKKPTVVPGNFLFTNAQKAFADQEASANINENVFKLWTQYWTQTEYIDESNYNIVKRTVADLTFRNYYRDVLRDLKEAKKVIATEVVLTSPEETEKANRLLVIDIMECMVWANLVEIFGNVPYSQSLDEANVAPVYDDAKTIYVDLLARLNNASAKLNPTSDVFDGADLFLSGFTGNWVKMANALKIRIGVILADAEPEIAKQAIESAYQSTFGPGEGCTMPYLTGTNSNPIYQDLVMSGRNDFVPTAPFVDAMNALEDPRREVYLTQLDGAYVGGAVGELNDFDAASHVGDIFIEPTFPVTICDYTEVAFNLAIAAEHGFAVGDAATYYTTAISNSMASYGISADAIAAYLARPDVDYASAPGTWKEKIGKQAWIAYYTRGLTAWTTIRLLDAPILTPAPNGVVSSLPVRFTYPINEQTLNATNYKAASSAIGGDLLTTKLFWDKY
ncbi:MAG TPA: SusD/RagB family nutrient-binding outer membrane lipoprotein [Bacteroidales bacterium]|nr:SusD/RagB family nutrient-binding outer membrane lipoprotein [Bacteroidales bacterium]